MLNIHRFVRGPLPNNVYLLADEGAGRAAIVDPGIGSADLLDFARERGWTIELILNTHAHFDHVYLNAWYSAQTGAPVALHSDDLPVLARLRSVCEQWGFPPPDESPTPSILLAHGQALEVCGQSVEVRHTPGHCPGQVAFIFGGNCVSGDTLFQRGIGRWDLPGADYAALERSIREQLYTLPDDTKVWPGHGEPTTIGEERRFNPFVNETAESTLRLKPKL